MRVCLSVFVCVLCVFEQVRCQTYEGGFGGEPWNEVRNGMRRFSVCLVVKNTAAMEVLVQVVYT